MAFVILGTGFIIALTSIFFVFVSAINPNRRIWPPDNFSRAYYITIWVITLSLSLCLLLLGFLMWGDTPIPKLLRFVFAPILILIGNIAVWSEVINFGLAQTSGSVGQLRQNGLYKFSRNPQYLADILIVIGWTILSASSLVIPLSVATIILLIVAPFAEESWLAEKYGIIYTDYRERTPRFL